MLKVKVKKDELEKGLAQISNIAGKFSSMPVLANVLLEAQDGLLILSGTDLELTFRARYTAEVFDEGKITAPAKTLSDLVHAVNSEFVVLEELENQTLELQTTNFTTDIYGMSPESFPYVSDLENIPMAEFQAAKLVDAINKTIYTVSASKINYNLSGIYWFKEPDENEVEVLRLASSDSNRLNLATLPTNNLEDMHLENGILVSRKGLAELKTLADNVETIALGLDVNNLIAKTSTTTLSIRLLQGNFPNYKMLIPETPPVTVVLNRKDFIESLKRFNLLTTSKYRMAYMEISENSIILTNDNPELGTAKEEIETEYKGPNYKLSFDPKFFLEPLGTLKSERFQFLLTDTKKPVRITAVDDDPGYMGIISLIAPKDE
ncbi:MAG: DNA polymerase III subunit beta [Deltaproteobacteria bacterium]|jgi:DNA polymerase-3 subunit beta|nr:DNA polymerase III subunit beta [Deltaproteobacteria bacterium]